MVQHDQHVQWKRKDTVPVGQSEIGPEEHQSGQDMVERGATARTTPVAL